MKATIAATTMFALGSLYAAEPLDIAFTVAAAISCASFVLFRCVRYSVRHHR